MKLQYAIHLLILTWNSWWKKIKPTSDHASFKTTFPQTFPSCSFVAKPLTQDHPSFKTTFPQTFPSCSLVAKPLTKDHPSFKTTLFLRPFLPVSLWLSPWLKTSQERHSWHSTRGAGRECGCYVWHTIWSIAAEREACGIHLKKK